jgi:TRAP-type C4-dicarboxylate transport system permease large subunit
VLTEERIPQAITEAVLSAGFGPIMFLVVVNMEIGMITPPVGPEIISK